MKIVDKIRACEGQPFFSFEYFPPKTPQGVTNLYDRVERMATHHPLFIDITWGAGGTTADLTLELSTNFQKLFCLETQMHLTCTNMKKEMIDTALAKCKEAGIQNIIALRGDPPVGQERWTSVEGGFEHALDLVKYIREQYGDYFGIAVAGYPEGHSECESYEIDLQHLKAKVDAGADLIITQLFYDVDQFLKWVRDCRAIGITVPILPGIMPINGYASWKRMTDFCKTQIPPAMRTALEAVQDDDEKVKAVGVEIVANMCKRLMDTRHETGILGLHMYTLNLEKSVQAILGELGLLEEAVTRRELPWRARVGAKEDVRPIFWSNRPKSYVSRTQTWDDFPNGRWGDSRSPAFGELLDYHLFAHAPAVDTKRKLWGAPETVEEVSETFLKFIRGEISQLPWCQNIAKETSQISTDLEGLINKGLLTINSQPRLNACPASDPTYGWGGKTGYVYQKAYVEFFCSDARLQQLKHLMPKYPTLAFEAMKAKGECETNLPEGAVNAVTWGVFPNSEILQPTVVERESFAVWREEAFALWLTWKSIYEHTETPKSPTSAAVIQEVHDTYWLVHVVDNDFVQGDIFAIFKELQ